MADLFPVAGAKLYIGPAITTQADDFIEADFSSTEGDWTLVDGWENAGAFGDSAQIITTSLINRGRDVKQKGTRNAGQMTNQFAEIVADAGQVAMANAERSTSNYQFRIIYDDENPAAVTPAGTKHLFVGLVTSWRVTGGNTNTVRMREAAIEINSNIVEIPAPQA